MKKACIILAALLCMGLCSGCGTSETPAGGAAATTGNSKSLTVGTATDDSGTTTSGSSASALETTGEATGSTTPEQTTGPTVAAATGTSGGKFIPPATSPSPIGSSTKVPTKAAITTQKPTTTKKPTTIAPKPTAAPTVPATAPANTQPTKLMANGESIQLFPDDPWKYPFDVEACRKDCKAYIESKGLVWDESLTLDNSTWAGNTRTVFLARNPDEGLLKEDIYEYIDLEINDWSDKHYNIIFEPIRVGTNWDEASFEGNYGIYVVHI